MAQQGRMGMTKAAKKADRLNQMQGNRKRIKAANRSYYQKKKSFGAPHRQYNDCGFLAATPKENAK